MVLFFFFKQKTAYEIYQCDWSSDVCSSDLWHGAAADAAFSKLGGYGLLSSEAADALPGIEGRLRNA